MPVGDHHWSPNIAYKSGPGNRWNATWNGNKFHHVPCEPGIGPEHDDDWINYRTWNNSVWWAKWDPASSRFFHTPDAAGSPSTQPGVSHEDIVLNYVHWWGAKYSAIRDGNGFTHIYVADPPDTTSTIFGQVLHIADIANTIIEIVIEAAPMVAT